MLSSTSPSKPMDLPNLDAKFDQQSRQFAGQCQTPLIHILMLLIVHGRQQTIGYKYNNASVQAEVHIDFEHSPASNIMVRRSAIGCYVARRSSIT